jgi:hypothetical protein
MTYAANTSVTVARSRAELEELVLRHGATDIMTGTLTEAAQFSFIAFRLAGRNLLLKVPDPTLDDIPRETPGGRRQKESVRRKKAEQLRRARWRLLVIATKAKLELIEAGQGSVEAEFLANIVTHGTTTLGESLRPQLEQLGESPPLLPAPGGIS